MECVYPGCPKPSYIRGLCQSHYGKLRYAGTLEQYALPHAPNGKKRTEDRWMDNNGYIRMRVEGEAYPVPEHRYIMEQMLGRPLVKGENVHHKNGKRDDNRPENLEVWVTHQPYGQRVEDVIAFVVQHHRVLVEAELSRVTQSQF